jgi:hypothetical protein
LIFKRAARIDEHASDQGRFAVIHAAGGQKTKQPDAQK